MINLESIILLVVIALVLFIDKFFNKKQNFKKDDLTLASNKKKNYFAFEKSNIVYWFPLLFLIIGFFINDDINASIYKQTGFIYGSLIAWFVIFYYVTFFSYKSLIIIKTKNKIIATEILYFFTIILLAVTMHFSALYKQYSDNRFVKYTTTSTKEYKCYTPRDCDDDDFTCGFRYADEIYCDDEIQTSSRSDVIEIIKINDYRGNIPGKKVSTTVTKKYIYNYQNPLISVEWNRKVKLSNDEILEWPTYFMPFLLNLFIIGYIWRFIFYALFWSLNTLLKE